MLKSLGYFGCCLAASWDARRLGRRLTRRVMACPTGGAAPERLSALRYPSIRVGEAKMQSPGAKRRRGNEWAVLKTMRFAARDVRPHPEERVCKIVPPT